MQVTPSSPFGDLMLSQSGDYVNSFFEKIIAFGEITWYNGFVLRGCGK